MTTMYRHEESHSIIVLWAMILLRITSEFLRKMNGMSPVSGCKRNVSGCIRLQFQERFCFCTGVSLRCKRALAIYGAKKMFEISFALTAYRLHLTDSFLSI